MQARHFLSGRGRPSSSAIQSNNCFITGPSRKSFVASIALGGQVGEPRWDISLLLARFFPRRVVPLHLSLQPKIATPHDSVFHLCTIEERHFCSVFRKGKSYAEAFLLKRRPASAFDRFAACDHACDAVRPGMGNDKHHHRSSEQPHVFREVVYVLSTGARICIGPESVCNRRGHQKRETNLVHKPKTFCY